jgi:hypothetical protein
LEDRKVAKKYDYLFNTDLFYQNTYPPKKAMMYYGLEKYPFNIRFTPITVPFDGLEPAHKHDFDEVFVFVPWSDDLTSFDGECHLWLDGEKYVINKPTVVHVPAGLVHAPIKHVRVGLPYFFVNCVMSGGYTVEAGGKKIDMKGMGLPRYKKP